MISKEKYILTAFILIMGLFLLYINFFIEDRIYEINKVYTNYNKYVIQKQTTLNNNNICRLFDCNKIVYPNKILYYDKNILVYTSNIYTNNYELFHLYNNIYLDLKTFDLVIKTQGTYIFTNIFKDKDRVLFNLKYNFIFSIVFLFLFLGFIRFEENKENMYILSISEAMLTHKTMLHITENIHHELNTPLKVLKKKIQNINNLIKESNYFKKSLKVDIKDIQNDFNFITISLEQISVTLDKMKKYKMIRYSNGDKTFYDIILTAFNTLILTTVNSFKYKISDELKNYALHHNYISNADFLSIMINHLKNSIEANSTVIEIKFISFKNGKVTIEIKDNGSGIPEKVKNDVFKANFSTKGNLNIIRGNGMFLNKKILSDIDGKVFIKESSENGTTFVLEIPAIPFNAR